MPKEKDPAEGLEPDITEITDPKAREAEQLQYYGGDPIDDDEDLSDADRGDNILPDEISEDRGDNLETDDEEEEEEQAAKDEDESTDADEDADDGADETDSEDADDSGDDSDEESGDDGSDDESEVSGDDEQSDDPPKSDQRVPLSRFNEINERRKAAEKELADLKSQETATEEAAVDKFDFDTAEQEYMDLLLDGKTAEAGAKRREIRAAEQELYTNAAKTEAVQDVTQQQDLRALNDLSVEAERMYPIFSEGHPDYNPKVAGRVITYMKGYVADGQNASDAFVSGLADVIDQYDLDTKYGFTEQPSNEDTEEEQDEPKPKVTKKAPIKKTKEKIKTAKQQQAPVATAGQGSDEAGAVVPDIENMTDEEYDALPDSTKARMRGDVL